MAAANPKWPRWVLASLAKHLHAACETAGLPLVVDTIDDRPAAFMAAPHKAEVSITGPNTRELSRGYHRVHVDIFCVLTSQVGGANYNAGDHSDFAGMLQNALDRAIEIREYEPGNNAPEFVGCIAPRSEGSSEITNNKLRASDTDKLVHSVIEGRFVGYFQQ